LFVIVVFAVLFFSAAPRLLAYWGSGAPFLYCAAVGVLALTTLPAMQVSYRNSEADAPDNNASRIGLSAVLMLIALMLAFMTNGCLWAYLTPVAVHVGVDMSGLSHILAVGAVLNLAAPVVAGWMAGGRVSPLLALMAGDGLIALSAFFIAGGQHVVLFEFGVLFLPFFLMFVVPFYLSDLVKLDPSYRCVSASAGLFMISGAIGPSLGGIVVDRAGLTGLAFAATTIALAALLFTAWGMWLSDQSRTSPQIR
jgi:predicted MFS family arabinose efflux permease